MDSTATVKSILLKTIGLSQSYRLSSGTQSITHADFMPRLASEVIFLRAASAVSRSLDGPTIIRTPLEVGLLVTL